MCPPAPRVCSEPGGQKLVLSLSLDVIGSGNGSAPNRHQAITWTNDNPELQHHRMSLSHNEFNIGSGNGLLPDSTKPLPEPMLTYSQWGRMALTWDQFHRQFSRFQFVKWVSKIHFQNSTSPRGEWVNILRPRQNGRRFADDIFKCIFLNENVWMPIKISMTFVPKGPINNIPALVQIMAWRRPGDKPLSEPMIVSLPTHICITRPRWVNALWPQHNGCLFSDIFKFLSRKILNIWIWISVKFVPREATNNKSSLVQVTAWRQSGIMPISEPIMVQRCIWNKSRKCILEYYNTVIKSTKLCVFFFMQWF